jgi:hypothetical protein
LTDEEVKAAQRIFRGEVAGKSGCVHCAGLHDVVYGLGRDRQPCPRVKRAVWHADGTLLEVEYWPEGEWNDRDVIYPADVIDIEVADEDHDNE